MSEKKHRLTALIFFTLFLSAVAYALQSWQLAPLHTSIYYIIIFHFFLSLTTTVITNRALQRTPDRFVVLYLATMVLRLLLSFTMVLVVILQEIANKQNFILSFAGVYLVFLVFEIYTLLTTLRANSEKGTEHVNKKI